MIHNDHFGGKVAAHARPPSAERFSAQIRSVRALVLQSMDEYTSLKHASNGRDP